MKSSWAGNFETLYIVSFVTILDAQHQFYTLDFARLATTDILYLVSSGGYKQPQDFYLLNMSDVTLRRVLMFSGSASPINYGQISGLEITLDAIFISIDNQLHVYGNHYIIYSDSL